MSKFKVITPPVLPVTIRKSELADYLGCHRTTMWRRYLPKSLLKEWGFDYDTEIKPYYVLSIALTNKIYEHFHIEPLAWYSIVSPHLTELVAA